MDTTNKAERYNGWTNYETWLVNLWLTNEEPTYRYWIESARYQRDHASECSQVRDGIWSESEAATFNLADQLKDEIMEAAPNDESTLYGDLINAALDNVDWAEIAESWLGDLDE